MSSSPSGGLEDMLYLEADKLTQQRLARVWIQTRKAASFLDKGIPLIS
jgi:hypothetical protein